MSQRLARLLVVLAAFVVVSGVFGATANAQNFIVLYKQGAVRADAAASMQKAGGSLVYSYPQSGVVIASSNSASFRDSLLKDNRVENASGTAAYVTRLNDVDTSDAGGGGSTGDLPNLPATDADTLSPLQWDMRQIHSPQAHAITGGSPAVLVGDIDTGIDFTHPDLAPNIDIANSANCVSGAPVAGLAAQDDNGHGTHTAGTIAAALNGIGIVGVAPNVKLAGIKAGNAAGFFFPEAVICSFMWAGSHHLQVTNNSYFADPWLFNCRNDAEQRAIWKAERRAIAWAQSQGVLVVAAEGNQADDLAHPTQDATSPDDTNPVLRDIHNDCVVIPTELAGVVGVTANGNLGLKSFYSSYGMSTADVVAPGGDSRLQVTAAATNGRVLSTWPANQACARKVVDVSGATYCYLQGTSMASPHVAGVAALVRSVHPGWSAGAVSAQLGSTADPLACPPDLSIYAFFPALDNGAPQTCTGGAGATSFYGKGQVNALAALK